MTTTSTAGAGPAAPIGLPTPESYGGPELVRVLRSRRSVRAFERRDLTWREIGSLLWSAQGITDDAGTLRAVPSAGALYPLELDVATSGGLFRYQPAGHTALQRLSSDIRTGLAHAALEQEWIADAACVFVISGVAARTAPKYGNRAQRYVQLEAGHAAQNLLLMAAGLGLGATPVGAFDDEAVARVLRLDRQEAPLYLIPAGASAVRSGQGSPARPPVTGSA